MRTIIALSVLFAPIAFAQNPNAVRAAGAEFEAVQAAAAAGASRAGDDALSCDQLQTEFVAIAQTPAYQNFALQQGATAATANNIVGAGISAVQAAGVTGAVPLDAAPPPEGKKKGGFLKKLGQAGQIAGAAGGLAGGLGGLGRGAGAVGAVGAIGAASAVAGAAGAAGDAASAIGAASVLAGAAGAGGLGNAAGALGAASALGGLAGAGRGLGGAAGAIGAAGALAGATGAGGLGNAAGALGAASALGALGGGLGGGGGAGAAMAAATLGAQAAAVAGQAGLAGGLDTTAIQAAGIGATNVAVSQISSLGGVAPELMRGARLMELGKAKTCVWSAGL